MDYCSRLVSVNMDGFEVTRYVITLHEEGAEEAAYLSEARRLFMSAWSPRDDGDKADFVVVRN